MADARPFRIVEDPRFRDHTGPAGHPERSERLAAVAEAVDAAAERFPSLERVRPRAAEAEELLRVHDREHLATLRSLAGQHRQLDPDTFFAPDSWEVARLAAGATIDLARAAARGEVAGGLAAVRPPGHHAESDRAMGFCLVNHVAVAARAAQEEEGVERVMVLDWDVHHGNGTQHSFEEDPSVLYVSTHQYPYYPGTGAAEEAGRGRGLGATLNIPMPAGCGDPEYLGVLQRLVAPAARAFRPDLLLVSCGFDAHRLDPLASMGVSGAGFGAMAAMVRRLAEELCGGRLALVLEGGYALDGLREGTASVLAAMAGDPTPLPPTPDLDAGGNLRAIVDRVCAVHGRSIPGLGAG